MIKQVEEAYDELQEDGFVEIDGEYITITKNGILELERFLKVNPNMWYLINLYFQLDERRKE